MTAPRRPELVIDLDAIAANVATLRQRCGPVMAVVKADGYGHGMLPAARAARRGGAEWLGVATIDEALAVRAGGDQGPLLCWLTTPGSDYAAAFAAEIEVTAYDVAELAEMTEAARALGVIGRVQLKVDTGLTRGGNAPRDWAGFFEAAAEAERAGVLSVTGIWSHLACSDEPSHPANRAQQQAFDEALEQATKAGLNPRWRHLANSAAALLQPGQRYDLVRCGIASYGLSPAPAEGSPGAFGLVPAMTARAPIALTKVVPSGRGISYGHLAVVQSEPEGGTAVVPVGYGDGIPRAASGRGPVSLHGQRYQVAGRVCMDQFVIEFGTAHATAGDWVVLFSAGENGEPTAQDWADACDTINYEIVTRIGGRFQRRYQGSVPDEWR